MGDTGVAEELSGVWLSDDGVAGEFSGSRLPYAPFTEEVDRVGDFDPAEELFGVWLSDDGVAQEVSGILPHLEAGVKAFGALAYL